MTTREYAEAIMAWRDPDVADVEDVIKAAVAEEREACAIVIDLEGQRYAERGGSVTRTVAGILSNLAAKIRARSNPAE